MKATIVIKDDYSAYQTGLEIFFVISWSTNVVVKLHQS